MNSLSNKFDTKSEWSSDDDIDWDGALANDWDRHCEEESEIVRKSMEDEAEQERVRLDRFRQWVSQIDLTDQVNQRAALKITEAMRYWHSSAECAKLEAWYDEEERRYGYY